MRKIGVVISLLTLTACVQHSPETVEISPPQQIEAGFVQVLPQQHYYIDSASIWIDSHDPAIIHFDMVTNLAEGQAHFKNYPYETGKSIRSHKKVNCQTNTYARAGEIVYSDFWGRGIDLKQYRQLARTVAILPQTNLDIVAKVLCANFYKP